MKKLLQDMDNVEFYINDLIVYTKDWATHLQELDKLLKKLRQAGLVIRPTNWVFSCQVFRTFHRRKLHFHERGELEEDRQTDRTVYFVNN